MDPMLTSLLQDFVEENLPLAQQVGAAVMDLEDAWENGREPESDELLHQIKAALHTIKGGSAMIGIGAIETLAHGLEDVCAFVTTHRDRHGSQEVELLFEGADLLIGLTRRASEVEGNIDPAPTQAFLRHVAETIGASPGSAAGGRAGAAGEPERLRPEGNGASGDDQRGRERLAPRGGEGDDSSIRVDDRLVDELMQLAGETVVNHSELLRIQRRAARAPLGVDELAAFDTIVSALGRTSSSLREKLLRLRLMPVSSLFVRFRRYVRDLGRERGQAIQLTIEGAETTLDRAVLSRLHEPLLHLVRNAIAHGIEPVEQRRACGKPDEASLLLAAKLVSGRIKIAVVDDGRGLDLAAIRRKAQAMGISTEGLDEDELRRLIFVPGFSTARAVSSLAGRGVGLDVVAEVVRGLGGSVDVESAPGAGTAFLLNLPVTVSQMKALLVSIDQELYAFPLGFLFESIAVRPGALHNVGAATVISWREELIPVIDGGVLLGTRPSGPAQPEAARKHCVILSSGNRRKGVLVDRLIRGQDVIVKPLDGVLGQAQVIFGLSVLGDGRVAPLLDCAYILGQGGSSRAGVGVGPPTAASAPAAGVARARE